MTRDVHTVLLAGATGQTGQQVVKHLQQGGYQVRALVRYPATARQQLGNDVEYVQGDVRKPATLFAAMTGVDAVISSIAAGSKDGHDRPETVDYEGVRNLVDAAKAETVLQFVLVSSRGVTQTDHPLNRLYGEVLAWKLKGENYLRASGLAYTIIRPASLLTEPAGKGAIAFEQEDRKFSGVVLHIPREDVAIVCVQALKHRDAKFRTFDVHRTNGVAATDWKAKFASLEPDKQR